jgi:acetate CoA/acetoacetate CoA-transferase beta subunit
MDLAFGARRVVALTTHTNDGKPKLVRTLTLPLTAPHCVDTVITELAVFRFRQGRMLLCELAEDTTLEEVRRLTEARFEVEPEPGAAPLTPGWARP